MHISPARLRASLLPAVLIVGLFGASTVSAAEATSETTARPTVAGTGAWRPRVTDRRASLGATC
jgi:hypothetical protein